MLHSWCRINNLVHIHVVVVVQGVQWRRQVFQQLVSVWVCVSDLLPYWTWPRRLTSDRRAARRSLSLRCLFRFAVTFAWRSATWVFQTFPRRPFASARLRSCLDTGSFLVLALAFARTFKTKRPSLPAKTSATWTSVTSTTAAIFSQIAHVDEHKANDQQ